MDDDLFQNAWSETTNTIPDTLKQDTKPSWSPNKLNSSFGEEADLAAPSWATGTGIRWDEPSGSPGFSWSQAEPDLAWGSSVYEGITLGKVPDEEKPAADDAAAVEVDEDEGKDEENCYDELPQESVPERTPTPDRATPSPPTAPVLPSSHEIAPELAAPPSPDGFGSFEVGAVDEVAKSPGFAINGVEDDPWGATAWTESKEEAVDEPLDEWERARQEKLKQDRRVPPEFLANILQQCEGLSRDMPPEDVEGDSVAEKDSWRNDWRSGIEGVPGLSDLMESILPPLALQPLPRFSQTHVAKKMATTVKLTKNLALTKRSPMSHYLAAKGSTAWEISVKEQKEMVEDDIPVGWRIVEKAPAAPSADSSKDKKPTGRLFSFWGRRQSQISPTVSNGATETRPSLDKPKSPVVNEVKSESRRGSQDSTRSSMTGSQPQLPPVKVEPVTTQQAPVSAVPSIQPVPSAMSSYGSAPDPVPGRSDTPPAPSAVSRFLNRFSRRGSTMGSSPRNSLALSSDDIEFLSDIVPSASDDADDDSADALEKFVNAKREPIASVLPPPLAPPPQAPAPRPTSAASSPLSAGTQSNLANDDFAALFGPLEPSKEAIPSRPASSGAGTQTSLPMLPPPLAPSRPITPSATPGAGPSRVSLPGPSTSSSSRPPSRLQTTTPPVSGFALPPPPSFRPIAPSNPSTMPKPQLSSPFPLPKPPVSQVAERAASPASTASSRTSYETAAETSPTSPTSSSPSSALPLGALYPHLVTPASPPKSSAHPMLSPQPVPEEPATTPSALMTPLAGAFAVPPPLRPPAPLAPPSQNRPITSPSAVPLTSNLFDDDDFSDFQSPVESTSKPSPPIPPPIAKSPPRMFTMPPAARSQTAAPNMSPFSFPPLPPPSGPARASSAVPSNNLASFDDDDFADFQASPSSATALKPSSLASSSSSLFPPSVSDQALLTPKKSASGFDDMGDFFSPTLRTPTPPRVPAKPTPAKPLQPPPSSTSKPTMPSASSSSSLLSRRKSHAAEHLHTLNLVEKAAARQGRWPAPPSPLPAAIPGPFSGSSSSTKLNLMDDEGPLGSSGSLLPSTSSPAVMSPARPSSGMGGSRANGAGFAASASSNSSLSGSLLQGWDFGSSTQAPPAPSTFAPPVKPANGTQGGGLSAQDLSFFESL
ncbi:hypothetical protein GY45DRAFT_1360805 [Cubamyces sp. BRFM 1775]|nr:hypothetical protein GY45DRAFT_1360805 [Cubamyces sp. BRFM 1775]